MSAKWLLIVSAILWGNYMAIPRGIKNHNPGNIRHGDNWQGMKPIQTDKSFVQFKSPRWGIRAMAKILQSYARRDVVYLVDIIHTWAPPSENDTHAYIAQVEKTTGLYANERVTEKDYGKLIAAIIKHENGFNPYSSQTINDGLALA